MGNDAVQTAMDKATEVVDTLGSTTIDLAEGARTKGRDLLSDPGAVATDAAGSVRRNPLVGIAVGVLLALALLALVRRRRSA